MISALLTPLTLRAENSAARHLADIRDRIPARIRGLTLVTAVEILSGQTELRLHRCSITFRLIRPGRWSRGCALKAGAQQNGTHASIPLAC